MNHLGLDALTRRKLQQQVLDIWETHRQAVMMITHDVDEAIFMSDRIVMMTNGPAATMRDLEGSFFIHVIAPQCAIPKSILNSVTTPSIF